MAFSVPGSVLDAGDITSRQNVKLVVTHSVF